MRSFFAIFTMIMWATAGVAHQLNVFAYVENGSVIVETKFSNGNIPISGEVSVLDAEKKLLMSLPLEENGTARFPLDTSVFAFGLMIEVETGEGHDNYWVLTPDDIARGMGT